MFLQFQSTNLAIFGNRNLLFALVRKSEIFLKKKNSINQNHQFYKNCENLPNCEILPAF